MTVSVSNTGKVAGAHTVLAFVGPVDDPSPARLAAFGRVVLGPGEARTLTLALPPGLPSTATEVRVGTLRTGLARP